MPNVYKETEKASKSQQKGCRAIDDDDDDDDDYDDDDDNNDDNNNNNTVHETQIMKTKVC
jgi:hypothetical protein